MKNNELHYFGIILCKHKSNGRLPIYSTFLVHSQLTTCIHWTWYCTVLVYVVIHFCDSLRCFGMKVNMCMFHKLDSTNISVEYIPIFIVKHTIERGLLLEVEQCNTNNGYNILHISFALNVNVFCPLSVWIYLLININHNIWKRKFIHYKIKLRIVS